MTKSKSIVMLICLIFIVAAAAALETSVTINTEEGRSSISPYIYGVNQMWGVNYPDDNDFWSAKRAGGNRSTGYNWENNASNAGSDWKFMSDNFWSFALDMPEEKEQSPGEAWAFFHEKNQAAEDYSLVTLQMAGYVSKDLDGAVDASEAAPSLRWDPVFFTKGSPFTYPPDLTDNAVYMDEFVQWLVNRFGPASGKTGIKGYSLDNEPALWSHTHPYIHPENISCDELLARSKELAAVIKGIDPSAEIYGPALYGFSAFVSLQSAPDWKDNYDALYSWFIDLYLDQMKAASDLEGKRLLDVLDLHWYPEAIGGGARINGEYTGNAANAIARMQAPRTLWDPSYNTNESHEDSWISNSEYFRQFLPLLPRVQESIDTYYPGTKLAFTEYTFGGGNHASGGVAQADALGLFGKYGVHLATLWPLNLDGEEYTVAGFKIFRDYDGYGSVYGDTAVLAVVDDNENCSVYSSVFGNGDSNLHVVLINKNVTESITTTVNIAGPRNYIAGEVWGFDAGNPAITRRPGITEITGNSFDYTVPPMSVYHLILNYEGQPSPTPTPIRTPTPTPEPTPTPGGNVGRIRVQYFCGETNATTSQITPHFNVINTGKETIALKNLTIRYYYTNEGTGIQQIQSDYAVIGSEKIKGSFGEGYFEVAFTEAAGDLTGYKETGEIKVRVNQSDWSAFEQTDDYSFSPEIQAFEVVNDITLHLNGQLIWGYPPDYVPPTPTPTPTPTPEPMAKGDVNQDGQVNIVDALIIARYSAGLPEAGFTAPVETGDVNSDGITNILDAMLTARYSAGLISEF